jgi:HEAT repeat protein
MTTLMNKCSWRLLLVACAALPLAGCGHKESKETTDALQKASAFEGQNQYQEANGVLIDALRAREMKLRPATTPTDQGELDAETKQVESDPEFLKMERAQVLIYLHLERADLGWAVYKDILSGNPGDSVVYDTLKDKDPLMRIGGVRILGLTGKPDAIPALTAATKDEDKDVRRAAAAALGSITDPGTVEPLLAALKDSYWFVRSEAAEALGQEKDARAVNPLIDAVADEDSTVEHSAESALIQLCQAPGVSPDTFASRLNDPNPKIVIISAYSLVLMKDHRAVPVLLKLAASPDLTTRLQATKGLGETGDPAVIPTLRQSLNDPNVDMRGWSITGLGNLKDEGSLPALRAIAADASQPSKIQAAAAAAVNHITGQDAAPAGP